jgi:hypothetical protein
VMLVITSLPGVLSKSFSCGMIVVYQSIGSRSEHYVDGLPLFSRIDMDFIPPNGSFR